MQNGAWILSLVLFVTLYFAQARNLTILTPSLSLTANCITGFGQFHFLPSLYSSCFIYSYCCYLMQYCCSCPIRHENPYILEIRGLSAPCVYGSYSCQSLKDFQTPGQTLFRHTLLLFRRIYTSRRLFPPQPAVQPLRPCYCVVMKSRDFSSLSERANKQTTPPPSLNFA